MGACQSNGAPSLSAAIGVIIFIGAILLMTFVHEFGHFLAARKFGMKVEEFFIGLGPRIFSFRRGETDFGLKPFLIAAYVKIAGMNPWQETPEEDLPRTYGAKPTWQRAIVVAAGSATHIPLAILLMWVALISAGVPTLTTTLQRVLPTVAGKPAPAQVAELRAGDRIVSADGRRVSEWRDFQEVVQRSAGRSVDIEVERQGQQMNFSVVPAESEVQIAPGETVKIGMIGVEPSFVNQRESPVRALATSARRTGELVVGSVRIIPVIFSGQGIGRIFAALGESGERDIDEPVGLVGAGRLAGQAASGSGPWDLTLLIASLIVFVGLINLLPVPPFDGGHLLILAIEKVRGRKVDMRKVVPVGVAVMGFFLVLVAALLYLDIVRPVVNPFQ